MAVYSNSTGFASPARPETHLSFEKCAVEDCRRPIKNRGWCNSHYKRWLRHGDPLGGGRTRHPAGNIACSIAGCTGKAQARGWCRDHYDGWRRRGDPLSEKLRNANPDVCTIAGCVRKAESRGWCIGHYTRWKKSGNVHPEVALSARSTTDEIWRFIHEVALPFSGDGCLFWPFGRDKRDGRALLRTRSRSKGHGRYAARQICALAHGEPPTSKHEAAHRCGRGHEGCINPRHLRWATSLENKEDMRRHGTVARGERKKSTKLKEHQVREILNLNGVTLSAVLAARFGVHVNTIKSIWQGRIWSWLLSSPAR